MVDTKVISLSIGNTGNFVALPIGTIVGRYTITAVLGQGGFGVTYRAHDSQLERDVAIKEYLPTAFAIRNQGLAVLPNSTGSAEDFAWGRQRFVEEGRTLASFEQVPGIVRVYDFLEANGTAYIVMALLQGETLEQRLKHGGRLSAAAIDLILQPLLTGLTKIHAAGFVHRDIKPANILLDDEGRATLVDFGAARAAVAGRTAALTAVFTPGYAAVEQFTDGRQGPWTDIYGLSATLYEAITGTMPQNAVDRALEDRYEPLAKLRPKGFAAEQLGSIDRGLAIRPADRPQSIKEWWESLTPTSVAPRVVSSRSRSGIYLALAALVLVATGGYFMLAHAPKPIGETSAQRKAAEDEKRLQPQAAALTNEEEAGRQRATAEMASRNAQQEVTGAAEAVQEARQRLVAEELATEEAHHQAERASAVAKSEAEAQEQAATEALAAAKAEEEVRQQTAAEEARRKAEEEAAAKAEHEAAAEEARRKAAAKVKAEDEARQQAAFADARRKAEQGAREEAAAAEAARKATAERDRKAVEAAEAGLRLGLPDRQRLQVALTAQGFDTRGADGLFGPRTRDMIAAWQKSRSLPSSGFLDVTQQQALLNEGASAITKYEDDQKRAEDAKKKAEEEVKAKSLAVAASAAQSSSPASNQVDVDSTGRNFTVVVKSGSEVKIAQHGNWTAGGCGQLPLPKNELSRPPANGNVTFRVVSVPPKGCSAPIEMMGVYYTPKPRFVGVDSFSYDRKFDNHSPLAVAGIRRVRIEVTP
jgi:peptidoglycan hydrolase-like protein with peptidoglycan-binding domain